MPELRRKSGLLVNHCFTKRAGEFTFSGSFYFLQWERDRLNGMILFEPRSVAVRHGGRPQGPKGGSRRRYIILHCFNAPPCLCCAHERQSQFHPRRSVADFPHHVRVCGFVPDDVPCRAGGDDFRLGADVAGGQILQGGAGDRQRPGQAQSRRHHRRRSGHHGGGEQGRGARGRQIRGPQHRVAARTMCRFISITSFRARSAS